MPWLINAGGLCVLALADERSRPLKDFKFYRDVVFMVDVSRPLLTDIQRMSKRNGKPDATRKAADL